MRLPSRGKFVIAFATDVRDIRLYNVQKEINHKSSVTSALSVANLAFQKLPFIC
jgi:hypothetical protein